MNDANEVRSIQTKDTRQDRKEESQRREKPMAVNLNGKRKTVTK